MPRRSRRTRRLGSGARRARRLELRASRPPRRPTTAEVGGQAEGDPQARRPRPRTATGPRRSGDAAMRAARPATKPRATRKPAAKADATAADGSAGDAAPAAAPKRRTTRKGGPGRTRLSDRHGQGPDPGTAGRAARGRGDDPRGRRPMPSCWSARTGSARPRSRSISRPGCCARPRRPSGRAGRAARAGWSSDGSHPDLHRLGPVGPGRQVVIGGPDATLPGRPRPHRRARADAGRGRRPGRDHRGRRADERGRPVRAAQDARGAAGRRDHHPVRRRRGAAPADRPVALLPGPARARRAARHRGDRRRPRPRRSADGRPSGPAGRWPPGSRARLRPGARGGPHPGRADTRPARPDRCPASARLAAARAAVPRAHGARRRP